MSKHTPSPWLLTHDNFVYALNERGTNQFWAHVNYGWKGPNADERTNAEEIEANARLIIAAPDMIEALEELRNAFILAVGDSSPFARVALEKPNAAIAKAKGEA